MPKHIPIIDLDREDVEDARRMSVSEKLQLGGTLFDAACEVTLAGIRRDHPGITRVEALQILRERLEWAERSGTRL